MEYMDIRRAVIDASLKAQKQGLIRGTSGNISIRSDDGKVIAITPTSIPYELLAPEDIPLIDENGTVLEGKNKPSSEMPMHTAIMRARRDVYAIVHTHSKFATVLSIIGQPLPVMTVPLIGYAPDPAPIVPFEVPGSDQLGQAVVRALGKKGSAAILEHHGMIAVGKTIQKAMSCTDYVEEGAEIAFYCSLAGPVKGISAQQIAHMREILSSGRAL